MHLKYKFCAMVARHPNMQWQLLTNMLLKKEFFWEKELGVSHFSMDLPKVALHMKELIGLQLGYFSNRLLTQLN
jgi:hypothetical protein